MYTLWSRAYWEVLMSRKEHICSDHWGEFSAKYQVNTSSFLPKIQAYKSNLWCYECPWVGSSTPTDKLSVSLSNAKVMTSLCRVFFVKCYVNSAQSFDRNACSLNSYRIWMLERRRNWRYCWAIFYYYKTLRYFRICRQGNKK